MDVILEVVIEVLFELYVELMMFIVPEKNRSKRYIQSVKLVVVFYLILLIFILFLGIFLITQDNVWGIAIVIGVILLSTIQIIAGIVLYKKNH